MIDIFKIKLGQSALLAATICAQEPRAGAETTLPAHPTPNPTLVAAVLGRNEIKEPNPISELVVSAPLKETVPLVELVQGLQDVHLHQIVQSIFPERPELFSQLKNDPIFLSLCRDFNDQLQEVEVRLNRERSTGSKSGDEVITLLRDNSARKLEHVVGNLVPVFIENVVILANWNQVTSNDGRGAQAVEPQVTRATKEGTVSEQLKEQSKQLLVHHLYSAYLARSLRDFEHSCAEVMDLKLLLKDLTAASQAICLERVPAYLARSNPLNAQLIDEIGDIFERVVPRDRHEEVRIPFTRPYVIASVNATKIRQLNGEFLRTLIQIVPGADASVLHGNVELYVAEWAKAIKIPVSPRQWEPIFMLRVDDADREHWQNRFAQHWAARAEKFSDLFLTMLKEGNWFVGRRLPSSQLGTPISDSAAKFEEFIEFQVAFLYDFSNACSPGFRAQTELLVESLFGEY